MGGASMRRGKEPRRSRGIWIVLAAFGGYAVGAWNADAIRTAQTAEPPNPAQAVAQRFPQSMREAPILEAADLSPRIAAVNSVGGDTEVALFQADPMVPQQPIAEAQEPAQSEVVADIGPAPPVQREPAAAPAIAPQPKPVSAAQTRPPARPQATRPRHLFDAMQIASIKRRLHLTPEQERMWPAVEVALRNIGAERERALRSRASAGAIDPNSPEVEDLKSAAIPLLMSFSDEQKDEVRSVVHSMGLDQLASEF